MRRIPAFAGLILCLSAALVQAQRLPAGPQASSFYSQVDDSDQPYGLYIPKNFNPARAYPLVVSLHGAWSNHRINLRRVFGQGNKPGEGDLETTRYFPAFKDVDYIVVSPYARGTMGYQGIAEQDVWDIIADIKKRFKIDEDRMYLTGLSMGGGGTMWLGLTRPDAWAAIAPVCPAPPQEVDKLTPNAFNLPVHFFHGDADTTVPPAISREWLKRLQAMGSKVEYKEYPGVKHNSWDNAYKDGAIFDWFAKFKRNRFPERVRYVSSHYRYSSAYWVRFDAFTPGEFASIDARFAARNKVTVETAKLDAFTLTPAGHALYALTAPITVTVDGTEFKLGARAHLSFTRVNGVWKHEAYKPAATAKRAGAEGPVLEAVSSRHIYVYGTADKPAGAELEARREAAQQAAEWSTPRLRLSLTLRALADREVKDADLAGANLVLFGTKETNSLVARYAGKFPVTLNADAKGYGLIFIYPVDGRYVVVNSGLPWWAGADKAKRGLWFLGSKGQALATFGDFILFKDTLANVIAEGRFDNQWQLPAEAAEKLKATGAVSIR